MKKVVNIWKCHQCKGEFRLSTMDLATTGQPFCQNCSLEEPMSLYVEECPDVDALSNRSKDHLSSGYLWLTLGINIAMMFAVFVYVGPEQGNPALGFLVFLCASMVVVCSYALVSRWVESWFLRKIGGK